MACDTCEGVSTEEQWVGLGGGVVSLVELSIICICKQTGIKIITLFPSQSSKVRSHMVIGPCQRICGANYLRHIS